MDIKLATVWVNGNKYIVSEALAADINAVVTKCKHIEANWQEEHAERLRLEERLKMADAKIKIERESRMPEFSFMSMPDCNHEEEDTP